VSGLGSSYSSGNILRQLRSDGNGLTSAALIKLVLRQLQASSGQTDHNITKQHLSLNGAKALLQAMGDRLHQRNQLHAEGDGRFYQRDAEAGRLHHKDQLLAKGGRLHQQEQLLTKGGRLHRQEQLLAVGARLHRRDQLHAEGGRLHRKDQPHAEDDRLHKLQPKDGGLPNKIGAAKCKLHPSRSSPYDNGLILRQLRSKGYGLASSVFDGLMLRQLRSGGEAKQHRQQHPGGEEKQHRQQHPGGEAKQHRQQQPGGGLLRAGGEGGKPREQRPTSELRSPLEEAQHQFLSRLEGARQRQSKALNSELTWKPKSATWFT